MDGYTIIFRTIEGLQKQQLIKELYKIKAELDYVGDNYSCCDLSHHLELLDEIKELVDTICKYSHEEFEKWQK